jgi:hypothetical protein
MPELSRPKLFKDIIISEGWKHTVLLEPVINMLTAKSAIDTHRGFMVSAEKYVFGTKNKGTQI